MIKLINQSWISFDLDAFGLRFGYHLKSLQSTSWKMDKLYTFVGCLYNFSKNKILQALRIESKIYDIRKLYTF